MPDYAQVDENNVVIKVITATHQFIRSGAVGDSSTWIECSTTGHIRGRYPGVGYFYDPSTDQFYPPKPPEYPSWIWGRDERLNIEAWMPPVPYPGRLSNPVHLIWDEANLQWITNPDESAWIKNIDGPVDWDPNLGRLVDIDPNKA